MNQRRLRVLRRNRVSLTLAVFMAVAAPGAVALALTSKHLYLWMGYPGGQRFFATILICSYAGASWAAWLYWALITLSDIEARLKVVSTKGLLTRDSWERRRGQVKRRDNMICRYCGAFTIKGHVDHIIPLSKGGTDDLNNLAWSCPSCNLRKGASVL